jgi:asparagine synthase (glutamine-hydrolysing)
MQVSNESAGLSLVFSGEEYGGDGRSEPDEHGINSARQSHASYILGLYRQNAIGQLNGRFHGVVVDRVNGVVSLFNDRYGMHRLYYHESRDAFYFAAEAKAILAVKPEYREFDLRGLGEVVSCGCVLENRTLFRNIYALPPASIWTFQGGVVANKGVYFRPEEWENQPTLNSEQYYDELCSVFPTILRRYFYGPSRIGISLTGGLDTRMIMAWHRTDRADMPCYSFSGVFRDCQDVVIARRVARARGLPHHTIRLGDDFLRRFPDYANRAIYLTDGCTEVSHAADLYVNEVAAGIAPVRMTGNYGGEVLRRVRAFKPVRPWPGLFSLEIDRAVDGAVATYNRAVHTHPLSFAVFRQAPWHHYGLLSLEQTQLTLRSPFLDNDLVKTVFRAPQAAYADNAVSIRLIRDGDLSLARIPTDRGLTPASHTMFSGLLQGLMEFTVKAEYAYDYGMPQWVSHIDHVLSPLHPERLFLGRHKFYHYRVWYRDVLSCYVRDILLDPRTLSRPYLNRKGVETIVARHIAGTHNYTSELHKLLTLELTSRAFVDPQ